MTLLTMLARVASQLVPPEREKEFMSYLARFIARPTLRHVAEVVESLR